MNVEYITLQAFQVNAYLLQDPASGVSVVVVIRAGRSADSRAGTE